MIFLNSQYKNSQLYTCRQVEQAKVAHNLYHMMGYPGVKDYKNAIKHNYIHDCPVTVADIEAAEKNLEKTSML